LKVPQKKPENVSFEQGAGVGVTYLTGYDALFAGTTKKNRPAIGKESKVLIIGASGGTGIAGVQLAKHGAQSKLVVGVCSGRNEDRVRALGADAILDYGAVDFGPKSTREGLLDEVLKELSKNRIKDLEDFNGFDLIYDTVSSAEDHNYRPAAHKMLAPDGHYVCINSASKMLLVRGIMARMMPSLSGLFLPSNEDWFLPTLTGKKWDIISRWMAEGKLDVQIAQVVDFHGLDGQSTGEDGAVCLNQAVDCQLSRRAFGKVIISNISPKM